MSELGLPTGYGQVAYEGYRVHSGGKSLVSGAPIPEWHELGEEIRAAWDASAKAVIDYIDRCFPR
jgi:hypothetical protein